MADYINMQQTEYDEIQIRLKKIHEDIFSGEAAIREKVLTLTEMEGGFYIENVSIKIKGLLCNLGLVPLKQLQQIFQNTEDAVADYINAVIQIDIVED